MPMPKLNFSSPWLIPLATAVWAVWTWATDLARERRKEHARVPALKNDSMLFVCAALAMVVVSAWIGQATDKLSVVVGPTWGGMLNAAFGNLPELMFGLIALSKGLGPLVKAAWTGSILGNLYLVLGGAMLFGGIKHGRQKFPVERANDAFTSLLIAVVALSLPTVYVLTFRQPDVV